VEHAWWERQIRIAPSASPPSIARSARLCALADSEACHDRSLGRKAITLPQPSGRDVVLDLLRDQLGDLGDTHIGVHAHAFTLPGADDIQVSTRYVVYLFKRICHSLHPVDGA
jgi:hypothetical protein